MTIRSKALHSVHHVISRGNFPARYVVADLAARVLVPGAQVVKGNVAGYSLDLDLKDTIQRQIYFGMYEPEVSNLLKNLLRRGSTFFDVGANVGYFTFLASSIVGAGGWVHSFEPIPENCGRITNNVSKNLIRNVVIHQVAVGKSQGSLTLYTSQDTSNSGWASVVPSPRRLATIDVPSISLDAYVASDPVRMPDVIKIDIEGAELQALRGMTELLSTSPRTDLIMEINPFLLERAGSTAGELIQWLRARDYRVFRITERGCAEVGDEWHPDSLANVFASRDPDRNRGEWTIKS
jgi:FkbM family methyltransferase